MFNILCETKKKVLRSIKYLGWRHAIRKPLKFSLSELLKISKIESIDRRCEELNVKYFENAFRNENELVTEVCKYYLNWYPDTRVPKYKTILCYLRSIVKKHC